MCAVTGLGTYHASSREWGHSGWMHVGVGMELGHIGGRLFESGYMQVGKWSWNTYCDNIDSRYIQGWQVELGLTKVCM